MPALQTGKLSWKGSEVGVLAGCHRNVSMIGTRPQSGENKPAASMALSAWEWKHTVGGGTEVSPGRKEQRSGFFWGEGGQRCKDTASCDTAQDLSRQGPRGHVYSKMGEV